jgi:hypothetical protein
VSGAENGGLSFAGGVGGFAESGDFASKFDVAPACDSEMVTTGVCIVAADSGDPIATGVPAPPPLFRPLLVIDIAPLLFLVTTSFLHKSSDGSVAESPLIVRCLDMRFNPERPPSPPLLPPLPPPPLFPAMPIFPPSSRPASDLILGLALKAKASLSCGLTGDATKDDSAPRARVRPDTVDSGMESIVEYPSSASSLSSSKSSANGCRADLESDEWNRDILGDPTADDEDDCFTTVFDDCTALNG